MNASWKFSRKPGDLRLVSEAETVFGDYVAGETRKRIADGNHTVGGLVRCYLVAYVRYLGPDHGLEVGDGLLGEPERVGGWVRNSELWSLSRSLERRHVMFF